MKNKLLRVAAFCLVLCAVLSLASCGKNSREQYPQPTDKFFVNDFAGVMTDADINTVYTAGVALHDATTAQAVVVTVDSLNGEDSADYALELGRKWGVGDDEHDNGVVILLSKSDRDIYIAVGYGLEGALPDSKTGRIIDNYGSSYFSDDNFSAGLVSVYNAIVNEIYIEYGMPTTENYIPADLLPDAQNDNSVSDIVVSWLVLIILVALYIGIFGRRGGLFIFGSSRFFCGGNHHGNFGSGSFGGFGGFKGGGGSFGGGGAGRKF